MSTSQLIPISQLSRPDFLICSDSEFEPEDVDECRTFCDKIYDELKRLKTLNPNESYVSLLNQILTKLNKKSKPNQKQTQRSRQILKANRCGIAHRKPYQSQSLKARTVEPQPINQRERMFIISNNFKLPSQTIRHFVQYQQQHRRKSPKLEQGKRNQTQGPSIRYFVSKVPRPQVPMQPKMQKVILQK